MSDIVDEVRIIKSTANYTENKCTFTHTDLKYNCLKETWAWTLFETKGVTKY